MLIYHSDTLEADGLNLGVQTNDGLVMDEAHALAVAWAPRPAKSYTVCIRHTDYNGRDEIHETGYAHIKVRYFTTRSEGLTSILP
jgi:hypothetical protein